MNRSSPLCVLDRLPAVCWLALPALALMPVWRWSAARLLDRSDDPLGIVALGALAVLMLRERRRFAAPPRTVWLVFALVLTAVAVLNVVALPALVRGVVAVLAMVATLMALRDPAQPLLAFAGLGLLALPLLSSLQFFAGFPLRVVVAEASRALLVLGGVDAERQASTLLVGGRLVMVDAPCAGIHMAWLGYFTAFTAAAWRRVPDARLVRRLPLVGVAVLVGNVARNTVLTVKEAGIGSWPAWSHDAIGVAVFALVSVFIVWHVARPGVGSVRGTVAGDHAGECVVSGRCNGRSVGSRIVRPGGSGRSIGRGVNSSRRG